MIHQIASLGNYITFSYNFSQVHSVLIPTIETIATPEFWQVCFRFLSFDSWITVYDKGKSHEEADNTR